MPTVPGSAQRSPREHPVSISLEINVEFVVKESETSALCEKLNRLTVHPTRSLTQGRKIESTVEDMHKSISSEITLQLTKKETSGVVYLAQDLSREGLAKVGYTTRDLDIRIHKSAKNAKSR